MTSQQTQRRSWLITGGAGFIGSHLAEALVLRDQHVVVIDNLSTGSLLNIQHLTGFPNFRFIRASITDGIDLSQFASQADVIVHLAAAVGVKLIVEHPVHTVETNINGSERVLKAALPYGCPVLIASTSEVYGKASKIPFSENDDVVLGATTMSRWAYAASKMVDEFLGFAYHREYGLPVTVMRLFNTVGPRQTGRYGMVIPRFVEQALRGDAITVYGDGSQSRCFSDVRDVVEAIIGLAVQPEAAGQVYNIGSTEEVTIRELAEKIRALTLSTSQIVNISYSKAYAPGFEDMQRRVPSIERIRALIGWQPKRSLDCILKTILNHQQQSESQIEQPMRSAFLVGAGPVGD